MDSEDSRKLSRYKTQDLLCRTTLRPAHDTPAHHHALRTRPCAAEDFRTSCNTAKQVMDDPGTSDTGAPVAATTAVDSTSPSNGVHVVQKTPANDAKLARNKEKKRRKKKKKKAPVKPKLQETKVCYCILILIISSSYLHHIFIISSSPFSSSHLLTFEPFHLLTTTNKRVTVFSRRRKRL